MVNKEQIDKYDDFFKSVSEFLERIGLCEKGKIEGVTDNEICEFCSKNDTILPPVLWAYARRFGYSIPLKNSDYNVSLSLSNIESAIKQADVVKEWLGGKRLKEFIKEERFKVNYDDEVPEDNVGMYTPEISSLMEVNNALFYYYDPYSRSFTFVDSTQENPIVFDILSYKVVTSQFYSFTTTVRDMMFTFMVNFFSCDFIENNIYNQIYASLSPEMEIDCSEGYDCLKMYQTAFKHLSNAKRLELKHLRNIFYVQKDKEEKQTGKILLMNEFENEFVELLKESNFFDSLKMQESVLC